MKTQKELKEMYKNILKNEIWDSERMVNYCLKEADYIVELENGDIVTIDKPRIEKDFCFGYSDSRYDTEDYDRANDMAHHAKTNEDYFMKENLKEINRMIDKLEGKERSNYKFYIRIPYTGQPDNSKLKSIQQLDNYYDANKIKECQILEGENLKRVIEGYKVVKANFEKRLKTYLKRYGLSKVRSWSYWRDA